MRKNNQGFSLVELIIVIAIMAILVGIVGMQVIPYMNNSKRAKDIQIISAYATAGVAAYSCHADSAEDMEELMIGISSEDGHDKYVASDVKAQNIADELKNLIDKDYITNADDSFSSKEFKNTELITVIFDFENRTVNVIANDGTNNITEDEEVEAKL